MIEMKQKHGVQRGIKSLKVNQARPNKGKECVVIVIFACKLVIFAISIQTRMAKHSVEIVTTNVMRNNA